MLQPVSMPFDAYIELPLRVSSTCLVSVDRNRYSVPADWVGKVVSVRFSAHGIRVRPGGELVARHERKFGRNQLICEPWHYLSILETKLDRKIKICVRRHGLPFTAWVLPPAVAAVRVQRDNQGARRATIRMRRCRWSGNAGGCSPSGVPGPASARK